MSEPGNQTAVVRCLPWWAHPATGLAVFALPGTLISYATSAARFPQLWGVPKYVGFGEVVGALAAVGSFACGSMWWRFVQRPRRRASAGPVDDDRLVAAFRFLAYVAFVSYCLWGLIGLHRGVRLPQLQAVLAGVPSAAFDLKQLMAPVAGITTFTQTAPIAAALAGLLIRRGRGPAVLASLTVLSGLAVIRGYFLSERLAILEVGLPLALAWLLTPTAGPRRRADGRLGRALFPLVYLGVAAAIFVAFEYNRSWAYYRNVSDVSYATFARERFLGYYTTPPNNAVVLQRHQAGLRPDTFTMQWLDQMPLLDHFVDFWNDRTPATDILVSSANGDFNTEGALFAPAIDWGPSASILMWFVGGAAFAVVFERVRRGNETFLPLYATAYLGIVESGRYFYWGQGRASVPLVAGLLVARYLRAGVPPVGRHRPAAAGLASPGTPVGCHPS